MQLFTNAVACRHETWCVSSALKCPEGTQKNPTNNILINFAYCYETSLDRFLKNIDTNYDIILSAILIYVKTLLFQTSPRPGVGNNGPEVPMSCRV